MKQYKVIFAAVMLVCVLPVKADQADQQVASIEALDLRDMAVVTGQGYYRYLELPQAKPLSEGVVYQPKVIHKRHRAVRIAGTRSGGTALASAANANFIQDRIRDQAQQGLATGLNIAGVPYAGVVACTVMRFGSLVQDGVKHNEHWSPADTLGNLFIISAPNCIFPFDGVSNAKTPIEGMLIAGDGIGSYIPPYSFIPGFVRGAIVKSLAKIFSPPAPADKKEKLRKIAGYVAPLQLHARR